MEMEMSQRVHFFYISNVIKNVDFWKKNDKKSLFWQKTS